MSNFAKVINNIVEQVIVCEKDIINAGTFGNPNEWIEVFNNNYPSIGDIYDIELNAFYSEKPYNSWILNPTTFQWESPINYPNDGNRYNWNESNLTWDVV